jgi:3-carboxy-cis,cis-muconate cycloisomerase
MPVHFIDSVFHSRFFSPRARRIWDDRTTLQRILDVEAVLAQAQADLNLIPHDAALEIKRKARLELFDVERISAEIAFMHHPLVPILEQFESLCDDGAGGYLHWGATTQNIFDIATVLQLRETHAALLEHLSAIRGALTRLIETHRDTLMAGRTHGQHALPMTFGFKLAAWLDELERAQTRLEQAATRAFVVTFGGAIGTLASLGDAGLRVQARVAQILELAAADVPVRTAYDRFAEYVAALGLFGAAFEKIAQEIVFMQRTEIGEAEEPFHFGKVGSSTMPQKRNPTRCLDVIGVSRLLRGNVGVILENTVSADEGDASSGIAVDALIGSSAVYAMSIAEIMHTVLDGLIVHPSVMRRNLEASGGLILAESVMMTLAQHLGRQEAHHVVYQAAMQSVENGSSFRDAVLAHPLTQGKLDRATLEAALEPQRYLGTAHEAIDQALSSARPSEVVPRENANTSVAK